MDITKARHELSYPPEFTWRGVLMDQIRLGATGLHVSRLCLGMMSYGNASDRPWVLDETAAEPIIRRAVEAGSPSLTPPTSTPLVPVKPPPGG